MSWYRDAVLPRVLNLCMTSPAVTELRGRVTRGLHGTVVELGFGSGLNLPHLPPEVDRVLAVDPATLGRRLAKERIEAADVEVEFAGLDGARLDLDDRVADCVLVTWSLCTIPDPEAAVAEARRVLKPGGALHFVEHGRAPDPRPAAWQDRLDRPWGWFSGGCSLTREAVLTIPKHGFQLGDVDGFYIPETPRFLGWTTLGTARAV